MSLLVLYIGYKCEFVILFKDDGSHLCNRRPDSARSVWVYDLLHEVYADFGFDNIILSLSTRPEQRVGSDEVCGISLKKP